MSGISDDLIRTLLAYMKKLGRRPKVDAYKTDVLDHAIENLKFGGDEATLWAAVVAADAAGPLLTPGQSGANGGGREEVLKLPPLWDSSDLALVTAPYRFTPVNTRVSRLKCKQTSQSEPVDGNLSCVIDVDWAVETPLLIGEPSTDGKSSQPFKLGEDFAIPGATLRGAMRSVLEVLGFARLFQINRHQKFGLRNFDHQYYRDYIRRDLKAGWLQKVHGAPQITPCDWGYVEIEHILGSNDHRKRWDWAESKREGKYAKHKMAWKNKDAFSARVGFSFLSEDNGRKIYRADGGSKPGTYVFAGSIPLGGTYSAEKTIKKRFEYVFFDTAAGPVPLNHATWDRFEVTHCKPSQNKRKPDGAWAEFEPSYQNGGRVPVFYSGRLTSDDSDAEFSFGLTRLYRIPHKFSLGDMLLRSDEKHRPAELIDKKLTLQPDFVEHLFGYSYEPDELAFGHGLLAKTAEYTAPPSVSRKGRLAFGFARPKSRTDFKLWPDAPIRTVMGAPKPSFGPFYLDGVEKDYSSELSRLSGRKRYITRRIAGEEDKLFNTLKQSLSGSFQGADTNTASDLRFVVPTRDDSVFHNRIKGHNLTAAELGGLLWALGFGGNPDARHLLGRGKAFGAGQVRANCITIHLRRNGGGAPAAGFDWTPQQGPGAVQTYLDAFEAEIAGLTAQSVAQWRASAEVTALLKLATPRGWSEPGTGYLPYQPPGRKQAENFAALRGKTRLGAARHPLPKQPPKQMLKP